MERRTLGDPPPELRAWCELKDCVEGLSVRVYYEWLVVDGDRRMGPHGRETIAWLPPTCSGPEIPRLNAALRYATPHRMDGYHLSLSLDEDQVKWRRGFTPILGG